MYSTPAAGIAAPDTPSSWHPIDNWNMLEGRDVEIYCRDRIVDRGTVESVTADGRILWLSLDGATSRRLIEKLPGTYVRHSAGGRDTTLQARTDT